MLTTKEIKKELDAGREVELECVDREGLLGMEDPKYGYNRCILESNLQVSRFFVDGAGLLVFVIEPGLMMTEKELKYFRIKRPTLTFVELMHLVEDAKNKHLIGSFYAINSDYQQEIAIHSKGNLRKWQFNEQGIKDAFDFISSLYTETFVIESEYNLQFIKKGSKIDLLNGITLICVKEAEVIEDRVLIDAREEGLATCQYTEFGLSVTILKGATVTQKRSAP